MKKKFLLEDSPPRDDPLLSLAVALALGAILWVVGGAILYLFWRIFE